MQLTYFVEVTPIKLVVGLVDREQLERDTQVVQILGADRSRRPQDPVMGMGIVLVGHDEQPARHEVGSLGGEDLIGAEQHVGHRDGLLLRRHQNATGHLFVFYHGPQRLDVRRRRDVEVG